jgi:predicted AlkP superfamily pyrophosphatase or phosphodiesterase
MQSRYGLYWRFMCFMCTIGVGLCLNFLRVDEKNLFKLFCFVACEDRGCYNCISTHQGYWISSISFQGVSCGLHDCHLVGFLFRVFFLVAACE